jgi:hypothetical protein
MYKITSDLKIVGEKTVRYEVTFYGTTSGNELNQSLGKNKKKTIIASLSKNFPSIPFAYDGGSALYTIGELYKVRDKYPFLYT